MSGVQIFTESPISSAVKKDNATATATAEAPLPAAAPVTTLPPPPTGGPFPPQPSSLLPAAPSIDPPTPTVASHSQTSPSSSSYIPPPMTTIPPRTNSLTPSIPGSPGNLEAPAMPRSRSASPRRDIPPPPKVGEKMKPVSYYSPAATPTYANQTAQYGQFPHQTGQTPNTATFSQQQQGLLSPHPNGLYSPAPNQQAAGTGGMTASPAQTPTTATIPAFQNQQQNPANFEHPPGYVQNPYAADMTPEQRFASSQAARSPTLGYNGGQGGGGIGGSGFQSPNVFSNFAPAGTSAQNSYNPNNSGMASPGRTNSAAGRGGILDNGSDEGTVWGTVSGWAKTAGKKMSEVEGEVWKRINGEN